MENTKNNANITCRDKSTISEMKNTTHGNYSRFHTGNKNASGTEATATGKYGALKNKVLVTHWVIFSGIIYV